MDISMAWLHVKVEIYYTLQEAQFNWVALQNRQQA